MKIFKYPLLNDQGEITLELPAHASPRSVAFQGERVCLWAAVPDTVFPPRQWTFRLIYTGEEYDSTCYWYIGTAHHGPDFVLHVLEKIG